MRQNKFLRKMLAGICMVMAGGSLLANGCINTIASLPICGGVLTFCDSADQLNAFLPLLQTPDFSADPSCTIPLGCGNGDIAQLPGFFDNGSGPDMPTDESQGVGGGGGGGGGG